MKATKQEQDVIKSVLATYNDIGKEFDSTRRIMWPEFDVIKTMLEGKEKARVLDSGCGNGRIAHYLKDLKLTYSGFDGSKTLIAQAKEWWKTEKNTQLKARFSTGNILTKKYKQHFDCAISSAVLHHLPSQKLRQDYLSQLYDSVTADGFLYISVWNLWQPKYEKLIDMKTHACPVGWGKSGLTRYYYAYEHRELINDLTAVGFNRLEEVQSIHNYCFIAWKK